MRHAQLSTHYCGTYGISFQLPTTQQNLRLALKINRFVILQPNPIKHVGSRLLINLYSLSKNGLSLQQFHHTHHPPLLAILLCITCSNSSRIQGRSVLVTTNPTFGLFWLCIWFNTGSVRIGDLYKFACTRSPLNLSLPTRIIEFPTFPQFL